MRFILLMLFTLSSFAEDSLGQKFITHYHLSALGMGKLNEHVNDKNTNSKNDATDATQDFMTITLKDDLVADGYVVTVHYNPASFKIFVVVTGGIAGRSNRYGPFVVDENGVIKD